VERLPGLRLYVQNRTVAAPDGTAPAYAGLGEVWLDDVDAARLALASSEWAAVIEDATGFMELDSVVATWATTESSRLYRPSSDPSRSHSGADPSSSARARPVERASSGKPRMVFDELLADRAREVLVELGNADERWMFGGVAFMRRGHMFAGVLGNRLVVGMGAEAAERALEGPNASPMDFTGRPLKGYVYADPAGVSTRDELRSWLEAGLTFLETLPPKSRP
jgi:uncharacterized protein (TIGR02118 family)